jgi:hypothetical protein
MDYKLIDYRLYNPKTSPFRTSKNDKAVFTAVHCSNSENCDAFKNGSCVMWAGLYGHKCPYGRKKNQEGYSQRAYKFSEWISAKKQSVEGIKQLDACPQKMCSIGEYVYFPYPHWTLDKSVPMVEEDRANMISDGVARQFINQVLFTIDLIEHIINARPQALFGGEITSYQKEVVPKIVQHLREVFPERFKKWSKKYPETAEKFNLDDYVGRMAYVRTLKPGCVVVKKDCSMKWDGEYLITEEFTSVFLPIERPDYVYLKMKPGEQTTIKITSNDQVYSETEFKD